MFKNYLKVIWRNITRFKGYTFINVFGLAVGITCCLLIMLYVVDELSYDRYHDNADRIVRVTRQFLNEGGEVNLHLGHVAPPFAPLLRNDYPDLEAVRFLAFDGPLMTYGDKRFLEKRFVFAEPSVFKVFSFPLLRGDPATVLTEPGTLVICEGMARKYFGDGDPIGETIVMSTDVAAGLSAVPLKVVGVMGNVPRNSHFTFDFLCSFVTAERFLGDREMKSWGSNNYPTYVLLPEGKTMGWLQEEVPAFLDRHLPEARGFKPHQWTNLVLQPLTSIHLHSHLDSEIEPNGDAVFVLIFVAVALLILLIACINFMNLSTARSAQRAREVGMRKVLGSTRAQLRQQFLAESLALSFSALILAVATLHIVLPHFNRFVGRPLTFQLLGNPWLPGALIGLGLVVGLFSGLYPAFFLSRFQPVTVLKGARGEAGGARFRRALVVFQFTVSVALIVSMGTVGKQLRYMRGRDLGFKKEQVVVLTATPAMQKNFLDVKNILETHPGVMRVTASSRVPSGRLLDSSGAKAFLDGRLQSINFRVANIRVEHDYFRVYGMTMAAGRDFSREFATDAREAFVLNETAVREIGWASPQDAVGERFEYGSLKGLIIGVVKDFHFESLHQRIAPMVFYIQPSNYRAVSLRLAPGRIREAMAFLEAKWLEYRPGQPFDYFFVDENFDRQYREEEKLGQVFSLFSFLAVLIACLGLFGLASYTVERRTREIGIRKVLGASIGGIVAMLSRQFLRWVLLANLFAWPLAYLVMNKWSAGFAYRAPLGVLAFALAAGTTLVIALATVSFQTVKAANTNPVETLKYE